MKKENTKEISKENLKDISFEASLNRLEEIVEKLESGDLPLDESMRLFEEGAALSAVCSKKLDETEQKIRKIFTGNSGDTSER